MYVCFVLRAVIRAALAAFLSCPPVRHVHFIFVFYMGKYRMNVVRVISLYTRTNIELWES